MARGVNTKANGIDFRANRFDEFLKLIPQNLTDAEKAQVLENIGAIGEDDTLMTINGTEVKKGDAVTTAETAIVVDGEMSDSSTNAVQNKVVKKYVDDTNDSLFSAGKNKFDVNTALPNKKLSNSGGIQSIDQPFITSDFIEVGEGVTLYIWNKLRGYYLNSTVSVVCAYDSSKTFITGSWNPTVAANGYTTPEGTCFVRVSIQYGELYSDPMVFFDNSTPTEFIPFEKKIKESILPIDSEEVESIASAVCDEKMTVEIVLPKKINAVVGDTIQLFQKGFVKAKDPYKYDIVSRVPSYGNSYPRYYEVTPESSGDKTFTVHMRDDRGRILSQKSSTLHIVNSPSNPASMKHIAIIGDSLIRGGEWPTELHRRLNGTGGSPSAAGLTNIKLIGKMKQVEHSEEDYGYYGMGGWTLGNYVNKPYLSIRFSVTGVTSYPYTNNKYSIGSVNLEARENNTTQGTILFRVIGGNWWKQSTVYALNAIVFITIEGADKIYKCTTAHTSTDTFDASKFTDITPSQSGTLTRTDASGGDSSITYTSYVSESENPLWDNVNDKFSFVPYVTEYGNNQVDAVYVCLVGNGLNPSTYQSDIETAIEQLTVFAEKLHEEYPSCKLFVMGQGMTSEKSHNAFLNVQGLNIAIMEKHKAFMEFCEQDDYKDWCEYVDVACQFDTDYSYPTAEKPVNTRSEVTETLVSDYVHPNFSGYMQIADAVYRHVVATLCQ